MRLAFIRIHGFIIKNVIDFDEVGGFHIDIDDDMVKYLNKDKMGEILNNRIHEASKIVVDEMLDRIFEDRKH